MGCLTVRTGLAEDRTKQGKYLEREVCGRELSARPTRWWPKLYGLEAFSFGNRPR